MNNINTCRLGVTNKIGLTFVCLLWLGAVNSQANTHYVSTNGANDAAGGYTNWAGAATNIQWAVNVAEYGDTVLVSNGVYSGSNAIVVYYPGRTNVSVVGLTNQITLKSLNGPLNTIIDGNYPALMVRGVFLSANATLDGFTVRNCTSKAPPQWNDIGAGIYIAGSSEPSGVLKLGYGGTVTNCIVYNVTSPVGHGAGICINNTTGVVANCTIYSNSAYLNGGGVWADNAWKGSAIRNCIIWGNQNRTANWKGGGLGISDSHIIVENCLFYRNNSFGLGGGIWVSANSAKSLRVDNCTITGNTASNIGGGFCLTNGSCVVRNLIVYNNIAPVDPDVSTTYASFTNCCMSVTNEWTAGCGNITNAPLFVDTNSDNYRLRNGSPCINTGTNQSWMTNGVDLGGWKRIYYRIVDMGAYEFLRKGTIFSGR